jgi:hypothetical protein
MPKICALALRRPDEVVSDDFKKKTRTRWFSRNELAKRKYTQPGIGKDISTPNSKPTGCNAVVAKPATAPATNTGTRDVAVLVTTAKYSQRDCRKTGQ